MIIYLSRRHPDKLSPAMSSVLTHWYVTPSAAPFFVDPNKQMLFDLNRAVHESRDLLQAAREQEAQVGQIGSLVSLSSEEAQRETAESRRSLHRCELKLQQHLDSVAAGHNAANGEEMMRLPMETRLAMLAALGLDGDGGEIRAGGGGRPHFGAAASPIDLTASGDASAREELFREHQLLMPAEVTHIQRRMDVCRDLIDQHLALPRGSLVSSADSARFQNARQDLMFCEEKLASHNAALSAQVRAGASLGVSNTLFVLFIYSHDRILH